VLTGHVLSHYRLTERIGRDRDTVIYRGRDLRLERDVAVKVLLPELAAQSLARERFKREARVSSLVSHPHICAVHDSGEEDGHVFLVCELLEGQPLDELVASGPLPSERALDLGIQMLDALAAVHARGIVHGNLRPANVFVTSEGHVKLLDVGLMTAWWETARGPAPATLSDSTPTMSVDRRGAVDPAVDGIHAYRAPEAVRGETVDQRSDIFSAGAVLYEMATGSPAFAGDDPPGTAAAILAGEFTPVSARNPRASAPLDPIIARALQQAPDARYQSAAEMMNDLRRARRRLESTASGVPVVARQRRRRLRVALAAGVVVLMLAAAYGVARWRGWGAVRPAGREAVLVGSIANGTNDPDFDGTLRQALTVHLGQSPFLDIVSDERLREMLQMMGQPPDAALTHDLARQACERLGLNAMVEGSVSAVGRNTVVALVASDCNTGETIVRNQVEVERKEEVLRAMGSLASAVRTSLGESAASLESHNVPIEEATTPSLEALKAYTMGVTRRAAGAELESIRYFENAIGLDPNFALAYTTLSSIYGSLGETGRGEEYARKAYEHRTNVSERERLFITYQYHDRVTGDQLKAREALEYWSQAYPRDYRAPNALAVLLNRVGDYDRAIAQAQEAMRRNPSHSFPYSNLAFAYRGAGRYGEARATAEKAMGMRIETLPTRRLLYQLAELDGDATAARAQLDWAKPRAQGFDLTGAHAQVLAFRGRMADARAAYKETVTLAARNGFPQIGSGYAAQSAVTEALYGAARQAIDQARAVPYETTYAPRLRVATAFALAGQIELAQAELRRFRDERPEDTWVHDVYMPTAEAAVHLTQGRHDEAVAVLRRAVPYERGFVAALLPIYFRAEARFRTRAYAEAIEAYKSVLANRGADPFSPVVPLSQLGIARVLALTGDVDGSARAYAELQDIWRAADADFAPAKTARSEAAALSKRPPINSSPTRR
jgi:tetratricopeptide (TPR) repeat protein